MIYCYAFWDNVTEPYCRVPNLEWHDKRARDQWPRGSKAKVVVADSKGAKSRIFLWYFWCLSLVPWGDREEFKHDPDACGLIPVLVWTHFEPRGPFALISMCWIRIKRWDGSLHLAALMIVWHTHRERTKKTTHAKNRLSRTNIFSEMLMLMFWYPYLGAKTLVPRSR